MPGVPYNATFSFAGAIGNIIGIHVETPQAEIVDMTSFTHGVGTMLMVPTGAVAGGTVTVDYMADALLPVNIGTVAPLTFSSSAINLSLRGILESATVEARTGEIVRGTLKFRLTDYTG